MLTNLFYYGYYRPYMIGGTVGANGKVERQPKEKKASFKDDLLASKWSSPEGASITRSLSAKTDVAGYAKGLSGGVTGLKDISKSLFQNADAVKLAAGVEGLKSGSDWLAEDAEDFAAAYNRMRVFSTNNKTSKSLNDYADDVEDALSRGSDALNAAGLSFDEAGGLSFSKDKVVSYSFRQLSDAVDGLADVAKGVYDVSSGFLTKPLSEHMKFRALNYYYDYKVGGITSNAMSVVESGMLIDVAV